MAKSVALQDFIREVKNQITLLEDQMGTPYELVHSIGEPDLIQNAQILKNEHGYIPKLSAQLVIKTVLDLKFKVNSVSFTLKHTLTNKLDLVFDYSSKAIEFALAQNEHGNNSSINTFSINGNSEIHDAKKQKLAVIEKKDLVFLDTATLIFIENELPLLKCASPTALNEFNVLVNSPSLKTPLKLALDKKFKDLCEQAI